MKSCNNRFFIFYFLIFISSCAYTPRDEPIISGVNEKLNVSKKTVFLKEVNIDNELHIAPNGKDGLRKSLELELKKIGFTPTNNKDEANFILESWIKATPAQLQAKSDRFCWHSTCAFSKILPPDVIASDRLRKMILMGLAFGPAGIVVESIGGVVAELPAISLFIEFRERNGRLLITKPAGIELQEKETELLADQTLIEKAASIALQDLRTNGQNQSEQK